MARVRSYDTLGIVARGMDASMLRHSVLADNIANIDTPGFKRSDVSFQVQLQRALDPATRIEMNRSSKRHFETEPTRDPMKVKPRVYAETDTWTRNDGNNVDPEVEMAHLGQNTMYYNALTNRLSSMYKTLSSVVNKTQAA
jgi:flagellar basal-body rod protein FlgB